MDGGVVHEWWGGTRVVEWIGRFVKGYVRSLLCDCDLRVVDIYQNRL